MNFTFIKRLLLGSLLLIMLGGCSDNSLSWDLPRKNPHDSKNVDNTGQFMPTEGAPRVSTLLISTVTSTTCVASGEITSTGTSSISSYGHCYSLSQQPTISDLRTNLGTVSSPKQFESELEGLEPNRKYFVRAFATNASGTSYGVTKEFTTDKKLELAVVATEEVQNIKQTSALAGGIVVSDGGSNVSSRGICYASTPNPDLTDIVLRAGNGIGSFDMNISGLSPNTKYFVRAFATNTTGTSYGVAKIFTTAALPNQTCNIKTQTTGTNFNIQIPNSEFFQGGETIKITMFSSIYSFGQAEEVALYENETLVSSFGRWIYFPSNSKEFKIPEDLPESNCYNLRVKKGNDIYVTETITIIN